MHEAGEKRIRKRHSRRHRYGKSWHPDSLVRREVKHWASWSEMHDVMHKAPGQIKALMLELLDKPLSRDEFYSFAERLEKRLLFGRDRKSFNLHEMDADIRRAVELGILKESDGLITLTPGGREIAEHMDAVIPFFFDKVTSPATAAKISFALHVILTVAKLLTGFISRSAGLIADGIDNLVDSLSAFLVWLGIKKNAERLVSLFIVAMMYLSVICIALAGVGKLTNPEPIREGVIAFLVAALAGIAMLILSAYQYFVARRRSNFALLSQSVDARNHFMTSMLVCGAIILSALAEALGALWLVYADALASFLIGALVLKGAVELTLELRAHGDEPADVTHFLSRFRERARYNLVRDWLKRQLQGGPLPHEELERRFTAEFCGEPPRIVALTGFGFQPRSPGVLTGYLQKSIQREEIVLRDGLYSVP
jgi:hypothetical protein